MRQRRRERTRGTETYGSDFFDAIGGGSLRTARVVVPMVLDLVSPVASVADVGCGTGGWLRAFSENGVDDVIGIDGAYVRGDRLEIPADRFLAMDLARPLTLERRFDLVLCLEVAEHLAPSAADGLIESLTALGDTVLFSAAIPHQGGREHVNEQWPEYWAEKFRAHGFVALDPFRTSLWTDDRIEPWFAQNLVLYVTRERLEHAPRLAEERDRSGGSLLPLVHPRLYVPKARLAAKATALADTPLGRVARQILRRTGSVRRS